jgi:SAM-dependent methyltransferase
VSPVLTTDQLGDRVIPDLVKCSPWLDRPSPYVFSDPSDCEGARLRVLASQLDPLHRANLQAVGMGPGVRCLEVGAGTGTIARWMSEFMGPGGHVEATDIDLTHFTGPFPANVTVSKLDVVTDPIPEGSFDLITARALLHHLPTWPDVIDKFRAALRPGGHLVLMEPDVGVGIAAGAHELLRPFWTGFDQWGRSAGVDYRMAHKLPAQLSAAGFTVHRASMHVPFYNGGSAWAEFYQCTLDAVLPRLTNMIEAELIETFRRAHADSSTWMYSFGWVGVIAQACS